MHLNASSVFPLHHKDSFDTDLIHSVTAQMSSYSNSLIKRKSLTEKITDTYVLNGF